MLAAAHHFDLRDLQTAFVAGNLDPHTASSVHDLLCELARASGAAVITATHSRALAQRADRILALEEGALRPADPSEALA